MTAQLLTRDEAAALLLLNPRTLDNWRSKGKGPRYVKAGRKVAYRMTDLTAWVEENTRTAARSGVK